VYVGAVKVLALFKKKAANLAALIFGGLEAIGATKDDAPAFVVKGNRDNGVTGLVDMKARENRRGVVSEFNLPIQRFEDGLYRFEGLVGGDLH